MGLFDNIIWNWAIEEVDPLGMENITDDNAPSPWAGGGTGDGTAGWSTGWSTTGNGGGWSGLFSWFTHKKDDSKWQDGSSLIIKNESPIVSQAQDQSNTPVISITNTNPVIDTNSEIPDIDIGGDMNFWALIEEDNSASIQPINIESGNTTVMVHEVNSIATPQIPEVIVDVPVIPTNTVPVTTSTENVVITTITDTVTPTGVVNSLFETINNPAPEVATLNIVASETPSNQPISLLGGSVTITETLENTAWINLTSVTENTANTDKSLLWWLNFWVSTSTTNTPINVDQVEVTAGLNSLISESSNTVEILPITTSNIPPDAPSILSVDTPPENISEKAVSIASDIQKTKESLAERISGFLKELEALKASDEALLKEKQAAIAKLEEAKRPIEEELKKIQDDEKRINDTIDLLSNIKNI